MNTRDIKTPFRFTIEPGPWRIGKPASGAGYNLYWDDGRDVTPPSARLDAQTCAYLQQVKAEYDELRSEVERLEHERAEHSSTSEQSNLQQHARRELEAAGLFDQDSDYGGEIGAAVMELITAFAAQGHSGGSAHVALAAFSKVAHYKPLTPLTGEDHEWMLVGDDLWQNIRCGRVFKTGAGAYDIDGRIFRHADGYVYTNRDSRVPVSFPYTPTTEYVDVPASEGEGQ